MPALPVCQFLCPLHRHVNEEFQLALIGLEAVIVEFEVGSVGSLVAGLRQSFVVDLPKRLLDLFQIAGKDRIGLLRHLPAFHTFRDV